MNILIDKVKRCTVSNEPSKGLKTASTSLKSPLHFVPLKDGQITEHSVFVSRRIISMFRTNVRGNEHERLLRYFPPPAPHPVRIFRDRTNDPRAFHVSPRLKGPFVHRQ